MIVTEPLELEFHHVRRMNLAAQQNGVAIVRLLRLSNRGPDGLGDLEVRIEVEPDLALEPWTCRLERLEPGGMFSPSQVEVRLSPERLAQLDELESGYLRLSVFGAGVELLSRSFPVEFLPFNHWAGGEVAPQVLAAFVQPNHPALTPLLDQSARYLQEWTGDPSLSGYQSKSLSRTRVMVAAVYHSLQDLQITYINPPPSFEASGQKVRTAEQIQQMKMGTCLDLTLLMAAVLEQFGLHPLIVMVKGHAFAGVWLTEKTFETDVLDEPLALEKRVEVGEIAIVDVTLATHRPCVTFEAAERAASEYLRRPAEFYYLCDVAAARERRVRPLPSRLASEAYYAVQVEPEEPSRAAPSALVPLDLEESGKLGATTVKPRDRAQQRLQRWKDRLLDLTLRNRLLNFRVNSPKTLPVQCHSIARLEDELAAGKLFTLHPKLEPDPDQPEALSDRLQAEFSRNRLHLSLGEKDLERRALKMYRESRSVLEETGSGVLFLALGFLEWYEATGSDQPRLAPILLLPVELVRGSVREPYKLRLSDDEPRLNVTLREKLRRDFGLDLQALLELSEDESGLDVPQILHRLRKEVLDLPRWRVLDEAFLGFFSFTKFLMWMDLEDRADALLQNPVVARLIQEEHELPEAGFLSPDQIDECKPAAEVLCPLDADSSQLSAIIAAEAGASFVLQGPPGTGKSQTITNLIAQTLAAGRSVLFVAEKRAALEVVHKRLSAVGLRPFCLELHSNKARKSDVMRQLKEALESGRSGPPSGWTEHARQIDELRHDLNRYASAIHETRPLGLSVFQVTSRLIGLQDAPSLSLVLPGLESADQGFLRACREAVDRLCTAGVAVRSPRLHPWRDTRLSEWDPKLEKEVMETIAQLDQACGTFAGALEELRSALGLSPADWPWQELVRLAGLLERLLESPGLPSELLCVPGWTQVRGQIESWREQLELHRRLWCELEERYSVEKLLEMDSVGLLERFEADLEKPVWLSWFSLWSPRRKLAGVARGKLGANAELCAHLKDVIRLRQIREFLETSSEAATRLLGVFWQGVKTQPSDIARTVDWAGEVRQELAWLEDRFPGNPLRQRLAELAADPGERLSDGSRFGGVFRKFLAALGRLQGLVEHSERFLQVPAPAPWKQEDLVPCLEEKIRTWSASPKELRKWCHYVAARQRCHELHLGPLVEAHAGEHVATADLVACFHRSLYEWWLAEMLSREPLLRQFQGVEHERKISRFRALDQSSLRMVADVVSGRLADRIPQGGARTAPSSELGILHRELAKKRKHLPCRQLFKKLPNLMLRLKPCFLMSPLSVAQYLDPHHAEFDLVVFDEASQIPVWDAIGSLGRGRQAVVVGDSKQLPPTSFFQVGDEDGEASTEEYEVEDLESILEECEASGLPTHPLRWHYRSRDESLITFSNVRYYESKLLTFPSAEHRLSNLGVSLTRVPGGVYDRGGSRTNRPEAEAIVADIVTRLRDPGQGYKSIGVVTFNSQQQSLIEDLLDRARAECPEIETFFTDQVSEPVFVKNLENVQGDERDVILFSVTYGPDQAGKMTMHFGPLNRTGGERRLNVAVTRAREQLKVFSSIGPDQIDLGKVSAVGVVHLREFLDYGSRGHLALIGSPNSGEGEAESIFEEQVGLALETRGWNVRRQVGSLGYRLDLGIVHPEIPGSYLAGVECDGATYHSSRSARDRDRLRQAVLERLGWSLLRVWSSDWWHDPERELDKLDEALRCLLAGWRTKQDTSGVIPMPVKREGPEERLERTEPLAAAAPAALPSGEELAAWEGRPPDGTTAYLLTVVSGLAYSWQQRQPEEFYNPASSWKIREQLQAVLHTEAPISLREAARRVGEPWGIQRVTGRTLRQVMAVLSSLSDVQVVDDFLWTCPPDQWRGIRVPDPASGYRRAAEDIPLPELAGGAELILQQNIAMGRDDLIREVARLFGIARLGSKVKARLEEGVRWLETSGRCRVDGAQVLHCDRI